VDLLCRVALLRRHRDYGRAIYFLSVWQSLLRLRQKHLVPFENTSFPFEKTFPLFQWIVGDRVLEILMRTSAKGFMVNNENLLASPSLIFVLEDTLRRFGAAASGRAEPSPTTLTNDGWFGHTVPRNSMR